jgi:biopolymer transport protein TolR
MAGAMLDSGGDGDDYAPLAEINVTPLVDVMLVLLIIFMVAAPLMMVGVPVDLPKTSAAKIGQPQKPVILTVDKAGTWSIDNGQVLTPETAPAALLAAHQANPDAMVYVRGDRDVPYGKVMEAMGVVGQAGFAKVSLIAQGMAPVPGVPAAPGTPAGAGAAPTAP